jgi:hypothetical protein
LSPIKGNKKVTETKLEMTRKERKKMSMRNELFSPLREKKKNQVADVPDLFDSETRKFKFNISPMKQQNAEKQINTTSSTPKKKTSFQSRMKPPSSLNSMKSKIPSVTRTNLKSSAITSDPKWKKYLNKK